MKKHILFSIVVLLCVFYIPGYAQQQHINSSDSISIERLFEYIEENSSYRIFSKIDTGLNVVVVNYNVPVIELLESVLSTTSFQLTVFEDYLFVLEDNKLSTQLAAFFGKEDSLIENNSLINRLLQIEKASSENKIYNIGNPYIKESFDYVTLTGVVTDFKSGEALPGVNLILSEPWIATTTNKDGYFSIQLPPGRMQLNISGLNIKHTQRQLFLYSDGRLDIELEEEAHSLDEVVVTSDRLENIRSVQMGVERLQIARIKNIPMALGEVDILKAIQTLPGVKTVGEASSGFNVRGGATDQNLILLNGGTIYNSNHLFGFFSAVNSDMIQDAELYKSSIPAKYGGRISSVLDITGKDANKEKFAGSAGIGLVTSKLNLEIPIVKDKTSLLLSGRTTYSDWLLGLLPEKSDYKDGKAGFYDLGANVSHKFSNKSHLNVYGYYSHDRFSFSKDEKYNYSSFNLSTQWKVFFSERFGGNFRLGYDHYDYKNKETLNEASGYKLSFGINQFFLKSDFTYDVNSTNQLNWGLNSMLYSIDSGTYEPANNASLVKRNALQKDKALESALYVGDRWDITSKFSIEAGLRYSIFNAMGPREYYTYQSDMLPYLSTLTDTINAGSGKVVKTYHGPEFRFSGRYAFTDNFSLKVGFNSMRQYIHKLSNTVVMSPTDTWKLSDYNIKPQNGWQAAMGLYYNTPDANWEMSLEGYYKRMHDYLDYRNGAKILMNSHVETDVIPTQGYSYGIELLLKKPAGRLNGWIGYSYSRTYLRQSSSLIENPVNGGDWYPTDYDKPHELKLVGNYKFTKRYSFSVNVDYSTGRPITVPAGKYYDQELNTMSVYYSGRNSYRISDYFRTDISFNIEPSHNLTLLLHSSISIGVYNVTGRRNIYSVYYVSEGDQIKGYKLSIFGVPIPFITYNIKF